MQRQNLLASFFFILLSILWRSMSIEMNFSLLLLFFFKKKIEKWFGLRPEPDGSGQYCANITTPFIHCYCRVSPFFFFSFFAPAEFLDVGNIINDLNAHKGFSLSLSLSFRIIFFLQMRNATPVIYMFPSSSPYNNKGPQWFYRLQLPTTYYITGILFMTIVVMVCQTPVFFPRFSGLIFVYFCTNGAGESCWK